LTSEQKAVVPEARVLAITIAAGVVLALLCCCCFLSQRCTRRMRRRTTLSARERAIQVAVRASAGDRRSSFAEMDKEEEDTEEDNRSDTTTGRQSDRTRAATASELSLTPAKANVEAADAAAPTVLASADEDVPVVIGSELDLSELRGPFRVRGMRAPPVAPPSLLIPHQDEELAASLDVAVRSLHFLSELNRRRGGGEGREIVHFV